MGKFALLVGINYRGTQCQLNGCINDVANMKSFLQDHASITEDAMVIMTEDSKLLPTRKNIIDQLQATICNINCLAEQSESSELWVHYSGHGSNIKDINGDEIDGRDETIVPLDYNTSGLITDDLLHNIFSELTPLCRVVCIFDCCHSGTILDLKYRYDPTGVIVENKESCISSNITMISGCQDVQTSADAWINNTWAGAMTAAFIDSMKNYTYTCNYIELLTGMRIYLKQNGYSQIPQLCSSNTDFIDFPMCHP